MPQVWWLAGYAALFAALFAQLAMHVRWVGHDDDFAGVQKVHDVPTSRLGGLAVYAAYGAALIFAPRAVHAEAADPLSLMICALPVVAIGLWEDVSRRVHPRHRLAGAVLSAALASWLAYGTVARIDLPVVDAWLQYLLVALPITLFMVAGACNAVNLIDGAHGLAGGIALMMFGGLAAAAATVGDSYVLTRSLVMVGAIAGFMFWNYPRGMVFLGDAGAYFLGFMYAQLSIAIVARNPGVSAWFVIVLAAYPIVETLYSIYRRALVLGTAPMQPDAGHLHSLVLRQLLRRVRAAHARDALTRVNARVAPRMWLHGAICLAAALALYQSTPALIAFMALYTAGYIACHRALARGSRRHPPSRSVTLIGATTLQVARRAAPR